MAKTLDGARYSIWPETPGDTVWRCQSTDAAVLVHLRMSEVFRRVAWQAGGGLEVYQFRAPDRKSAKAMIKQALNAPQD